MTGVCNVIPFIYRLRKRVRFEGHRDSCIVISETPLNVVRVNHHTVRILELCDGDRTPGEIAEATGLTEEQVFKICNYFNRKAVLHIEPAKTKNRDYSPRVSIIVPVKDRAEELAGCLQSIVGQNYPRDRMELIVIDDGSKDETAKVARAFPCRLLRNNRTQGQSYCRNRAAAEARGEILAFIDSDCVASDTWIREIVPYFQWEAVGAVGGYVDGYFDRSALDRYEKTFSSLNMGKEILFSADDPSTFYVPTCNLLVRRDLYLKIGGITESLHVGEDVDFCWRMRSLGQRLLYVPVGAVLHKHRSGVVKMLKRRADYGTSEALLYSLHRRKRKTFQVPPLAAMVFLSLCLAIGLYSFLPLGVAATCAATEAGMKMWRMKKKSRLDIPTLRILYSVARTHMSFLYFASFHIVRYYLLCFLVLGTLLPSFWLLGLAMLVYAALVDYVIKRPQLFFITFLLYYALEHLCYQIGVGVGCVRMKTLSPYRSIFSRKFAVSADF